MLDDIRAACAAVAAGASHVRIDYERLASYAPAIDATAARHPIWDDAHFYRGDEASTVAFVLTWGAVNFGSGWFPHARKRPGCSGSLSLASALTDRFRRDGPLSTTALRAATPASCAALFEQDAGGPLVDLMKHFARAWTEFGAWVDTEHDGSFMNVVAGARGSAERLATMLGAQPAFRDVRTWHGQQVPFYKRAQLVTADLACALEGRGLGVFADLDRLTLFADNLVPHVLRVDGVLVLTPELAGAIDAGEEIPEGSDAEVEIRACAVHAVELLAARLDEVTPAGLDSLLWHQGQAPRYKAVPRHRTRTTAY